MLGRDFTATKPFLSDPSAFALRNRNQDLKWLAKDDARSWAISNVWEVFEDELREALLTEESKDTALSGSLGLETIVSVLHQPPPPGHHEMLVRHRTEILRKYHLRREQNAVYQARLNEPYIVPGSLREQMQFNRLTWLVKTKLKTRGLPGNETPHAASGSETLVAATPEPELVSMLVSELSKKALSVLDELLPPSSKIKMSTVPWQDFLNFMSEVGFVIETTSGSAFIFDLPEKGRINVHRPHPSSTLQSFHLRNIATGLQRAFGRPRENFREAQAQA